MKYTLVHDKDGFNKIIEHEEGQRPVCDGNPYNSVGVSYDTIEELKESEKILDKPCVVCGGLCKSNYREYGESIIKKNMCFSCNLWDDRMKIKDKENVFIVNGEWLTVHPDNPNGFFKGHGGREFNFKRFNSSEIITSKNVWCGGYIPLKWRHKIRDNAVMVRKENFDNDYLETIATKN